MFTITDDLVQEFFYTNFSENTIRFNIAKAINMLNKQCLNRENVTRLTKNLLNYEIQKNPPKVVPEKQIEVSIQTTKKQVGRKPLYRGKLLLAGTKNNRRDFWKDYKNALQIALDDNIYPNAQPKGFYKIVKDFLRTDWKNCQFFKREELIKALAEKHPTIDKIKLQCWGNMYYWQHTNDIAVKPLWRVINRHCLENIFWQNNL